MSIFEAAPRIIRAKHSHIVRDSPDGRGRDNSHSARYAATSNQTWIMASINAIDKVASGLTPISLLLIGAVTSGLLYALYLWALPKPLPGIPYDKTSASRILGDIPRLEALRSAGDTPRKFWCTAAAELGSPISQVFLGPFNKPAVIVSDFREAQDLQLRNAKLLSRGWLNRQLWDGLIPEHFIAMEDHDARYKDTRGLGKDLMTPNFLNQVSLTSLRVANRSIADCALSQGQRPCVTRQSGGLHCPLARKDADCSGPALRRSQGP